MFSLGSLFSELLRNGSVVLVLSDHSKAAGGLFIAWDVGSFPLVFIRNESVFFFFLNPATSVCGCFLLSIHPDWVSVTWLCSFSCDFKIIKGLSMDILWLWFVFVVFLFLGSVDWLFLFLFQGLVGDSSRTDVWRKQSHDQVWNGKHMSKGLWNETPSPHLPPFAFCCIFFFISDF